MSLQSQRYHYLDALRAFAMLVGILFHVLLSFVDVPIWPAQDISRSDLRYSFFQHSIHGFRMPLFFVVSGFFTALLWRKLGAVDLLRHRAKRIALPLVVGTLVMWPLAIAISLWGAAKKDQIKATHSHVRSADPSTNLWGAAKIGDSERIRFLLSGGDDPNDRDRFGLTPLVWAVSYGHADAAATLLDNGAEIDSRDPSGFTPLHMSALLSNTEMAQMLINSGAAVNAVNKWGETPLDSSRAPFMVVATFAGLSQIEVDARAVADGREAMWSFLSASGARSRSDLSPEEVKRQGGSSWGMFYKVYVMGAVFPLFHHLWFLYYLCSLVVIFLCGAWVWRRMPFAIPDRLLATPFCLIYLIPLTFLPQLYFWQGFGADTAPGILLWPPTFFYYAIFFFFGAACFGRVQFEERAGNHWIVWSIAALLALIAGLNAYHAGLHAVSSAFSAGYAWLMVFACLGLFRRLFSTENLLIRYVSDSSYWLYIAHFPLVISLQIMVSDWPLPAPGKFLFVTLMSIALLLLSYHYCVRYTVVGRILNGPRRRPNFVGLPAMEQGIRPSGEPLHSRNIHPSA